MHRITLAAGLLFSPLCSAKIARRVSNPFDFSQSRTGDASNGRKGFFRRLLSSIDGGGLKYIPLADGTGKKVKDVAAPMALRVQFHY